MNIGNPSHYYVAMIGLTTVAYLGNRLIVARSTSDWSICNAAKNIVVGGTRVAFVGVKTTLAYLKPIAWQFCKGSVHLLQWTALECSKAFVNPKPAFLLAVGASYLAASHGTEWIDQSMIGPFSKFLVLASDRGAKWSYQNGIMPLSNLLVRTGSDCMRWLVQQVFGEGRSGVSTK